MGNSQRLSLHFLENSGLTTPLSSGPPASDVRDAGCKSSGSCSRKLSSQPDGSRINDLCQSKLRRIKAYSRSRKVTSKQFERQKDYLRMGMLRRPVSSETDRMSSRQCLFRSMRTVDSSLRTEPLRPHQHSPSMVAIQNAGAASHTRCRL